MSTERRAHVPWGWMYLLALLAGVGVGHILLHALGLEAFT